MAKITLKGNPVNTIGNPPAVGSPLPEFALTKSDLTEMNSKELSGKWIIMNIFPSIDTSVCSRSVRQFNQDAGALGNTTVLCISQDLPFALNRFCGAEGIKNVTTLSAFRHAEFGQKFGLKMTDGPLAGLLARTVIVVDPTGKITYVELVPEIAQEPNYAAALEAAK